MKYLALFILKYILGWKIIGDHSNYDYFKYGKHVIIFDYKSIYELFLGYLLSKIFGIKLHICANSESFIRHKFISYIFSNVEMIYLDENNIGNDKYITEYLNKRNDFVFISDNKLFYNVARSTNADLNILLFDYENNMIRQKEIASDIIIQTQSNEEVNKIYSNLLSNNHNPHYVKSIINIKRSILLLVPPLIVGYILITTIFR